MELETLHNVRVLLVDDDADDYLIIKKTFERINNSPFILEWTDSFDEARQLIDARNHDVYLIDYRLGERTGLELLQFAQPEKRPQPFILLTGAGNESVEWRSLELAASDYLVKGAFDANLLSRTLYYALQRKRIEEQRVQHLIDLNRSKDEFISIASHQLRTPATSVKQYVGMLLEGFVGELEPKQEALLVKAYESNERQLKIVTDLLRVAQVDAGKIMLRKKHLYLNPFLQQIVDDNEGMFSSRKQKITFKKPKVNAVVFVDAASMRMVLENIIDNASKYSEEGTRAVVSVRHTPDEVWIQIADEGVGIAPDNKKRLFKKFSRLDNSLSTKVGGTGLGLYWARKIVELHGGKIAYSANKAGGTTFVVKLPKTEKV
jgi:signal transduction histidine kinase